MKIILASQSPRRRQILSWLLKKFTVIPADIDENRHIKTAKTPQDLVMKLARIKAQTIAKAHIETTEGLSQKQNTLIIAADTIIVLRDKNIWQVIGKPTSAAHAQKILQKLRGRTHYVYTGVCVHSTKKTLTDYAKSSVTFKKFTDKVMNDYVASGKPLDKAGAYGIQETGSQLVQKFTGSYTNIVGLPVKKLLDMLDSITMTHQLPFQKNWQQTIKQKTGYSE